LEVFFYGVFQRFQHAYTYTFRWPTPDGIGFKRPKKVSQIVCFHTGVGEFNFVWSSFTGIILNPTFNWPYYRTTYIHCTKVHMKLEWCPNGQFYTINLKLIWQQRITSQYSFIVVLIYIYIQTVNHYAIQAAPPSMIFHVSLL